MTDDQYNKLSEMYAKKINECADKDAHIASLESQLRDKDKKIELLQIRDEKRDARVSNMAGENGHLHALIEEKDKEIQSWKEERDNVLNDFELYREEKDKEIERLNRHYDTANEEVKSLREEVDRLKEQVRFEIRGRDLMVVANNELREALRCIISNFGYTMHNEFVDRCRKLIGE